MECWMKARLTGRAGNDGKDEVSFQSSVILAFH